MSGIRIDHAAREIYAKLQEKLAGPLGAFLSRERIADALRECGHRFHESAFSPLGGALGLSRPGA